MNLSDALETPLIFQTEDSIAKVVSAMRRTGSNAAVLYKKSEYNGMVFAEDLAKTATGNPDRIKIKKYLRKINPVYHETPLEFIIDSIINNDYHAVPVKKSNNIFIVTKMGIIKALASDQSLKTAKVKDIMVFPYCISSTDNVSTAMSMLRELNVSRLPVVSKEDKIEGLIEVSDLLEAGIKKKRAKFGEASGEKVHMAGTPVSSIMKKTIPVADTNENLSNAINNMIQTKTQTILVEDDGKLAGIVTPGQILKFAKGRIFEKTEHGDTSNKGIYIRVEGIKNEDIFIRSVIEEEINNEVKKLSRIIPIDYLVLHIKTYEESGERKKYSVKGRLITGKGYFFAEDYSWDITKSIREVLGRFERLVIKKRDKEGSFKRASK